MQDPLRSIAQSLETIATEMSQSPPAAGAAGSLPSERILLPEIYKKALENLFLVNVVKEDDGFLLTRGVVWEFEHAFDESGRVTVKIIEDHCETDDEFRKVIGLRWVDDVSELEHHAWSSGLNQILQEEDEI